MTAPPADGLRECLRIAGVCQEIRALEKFGNDTVPIGQAAKWATELETALATALRLREWRPIESAPKDGTEVLLCGPKWIASGIGSWDERALPHKGDWVDDAGALFSPSPTVWMPLPTPPTADDLARVLEEGE